jgi:pantoate--beta-alanine ligase
MILIKTVGDLQKILFRHESAGESIGFVPTMGALHNGHIQLIRNAAQNHPVTVCSIFVNPTQFNNKADFDKYPHTLEQDIDLLEEAGCTVLFLPHVDEMYPPNDPVIEYDLGEIEQLLEGKYRPGHFQGVCRIVDKLLMAVKPDGLYIGQKDYQQCMVIRKLIALKGYRTQLQVCDTVREADGLAQSSRNLRLSPQERHKATQIYKTLQFVAENIAPGELSSLKIKATSLLASQDFKVDYVEIAKADTLEIVDTWDGKDKLVALIAAFLGDVRLIDNFILQKTPPSLEG